MVGYSLCLPTKLGPHHRRMTAVASSPSALLAPVTIIVITDVTESLCARYGEGYRNVQNSFALKRLLWSRRKSTRRDSSCLKQTQSTWNEQPGNITFYGELTTCRHARAGQVRDFRRRADPRPKVMEPRAGLKNTSSFDNVWGEEWLGLSSLFWNSIPRIENRSL